jgi:hypothetical protein
VEILHTECPTDRTGFELLGLHATQQCAACHLNNNYSLASAACWNCHQTDFNGANNPPHKSAGFPQDCSLCHGTSALNWTSAATFDHATTGFALTGAHTNVQCAQCHANNNFSLTSGACWSCHQTDYNNTNNPPHKQTNFPQDCSGCHTMVVGPARLSTTRLPASRWWDSTPPSSAPRATSIITTP